MIYYLNINSKILLCSRNVNVYGNKGLCVRLYVLILPEELPEGEIKANEMIIHGPG